MSPGGWPRGDDWSQHLACWRDGQSSLAQPGPHGGRVIVRGDHRFERCPCSTCGSVGTWSTLGPDAVYCAPPGHRIEQHDGATIDICPEG